jgi:hypothetical protein
MQTRFFGSKAGRGLKATAVVYHLFLQQFSSYALYFSFDVAFIVKTQPGIMKAASHVARSTCSLSLRS